MNPPTPSGVEQLLMRLRLAGTLDVMNPPTPSGVEQIKEIAMREWHYCDEPSDAVRR